MNAPEFKITLRNFESKVMYFNGMYKLPVAPYPQIESIVQHERKKNPDLELTGKAAIEKRLLDFRKTLADELNEVDDIIGWMKAGVKKNKDTGTLEEYTVVDLLVDIADWLTDIPVYCASEMVKYGLPVSQSQDIVMASNFSKLGADGNPIYNDEGKVLKGPGYWKPEPQLKAMIAEIIQENTEEISANKGIVWRD